MSIPNKSLIYALIFWDIKFKSINIFDKLKARILSYTYTV